MSAYKIIREIIRPFFFIFMPRKVYNADKVPSDGPLIICANHLSLIDPVFIGLTVKRPIRFIAKKEACDSPFLGKLIHLLGGFPVDRAGKDLKAIRTCMSVLKDGDCLGIFPEGTRIKDGKVSEAKGGVALIAKRSKAQIVMVHIKPRKGKVKLFSKVDLFFSDPTTYEEFCGELDYTEASEKIMDSIYSLGECDDN